MNYDSLLVYASGATVVLIARVIYQETVWSPDGTLEFCKAVRTRFAP